MFTSWVVPCIPLGVSGDLLAELEHDDAPPQGDCEPAAAAREAPDPFAELELYDLCAKSVVPKNDFVWWVERTGPAAEQEEERRCVQRDDCSKGAASKFCKTRQNEVEIYSARLVPRLRMRVKGHVR